MAKIKRELSDEIADGICRGFFGILFTISLSLLIVFILLLGLNLYSNYQQEKCLKDGTCQQILSAPIYNCQLKYVNCYVVIGNSSSTYSDRFFEACGYEEANAKYEQLKPQIVNDLNKHNKIDNLNYEIKYLKCE
jgi:hypothetical protein